MALRLFSVAGNTQRLDGGAMFGNAPRALWSRWIEPDAENRIELACRALLVVAPERRVLLEAGIGAFFAPELKRRFGIAADRHVLLDSLAQLGFDHTRIDVVVLSHLHFDHAGGLLTAWRDGAEPELLFPNARYAVSAAAWERARAPHPRDRASFVPRLNELLEASGRLDIVGGGDASFLGDGWRFRLSNGHTPGMLLTEVPAAGGPVVFAADLVPGLAWVRRAITMGYDRYPELLIDEKVDLLEDLVARDGRLFFTHDPGCDVCRLKRDAKGRIVAAAGTL